MFIGSVHVILFYVELSGVYMRQSISVTSRNEHSILKYVIVKQKIEFKICTAQ